jgi:hypothetical protein
MSVYEETGAGYLTRIKDLNLLRFVTGVKWCRLDSAAWRRMLKEQIRNYSDVREVSLASIVVETGWTVNLTVWKTGE